MLICVGTGGSGKTLLLKALAANNDPGSVSKHVATVPTTGSNIVKITRTRAGEAAETVTAREVGGERTSKMLHISILSTMLQVLWLLSGSLWLNLTRLRCMD